MRTSPHALLIAGVLLFLIVSLSALPWYAQAAGIPAFPSLSIPSGPPEQPFPPAPAHPEAQRLLELVNQARWENGRIPPLKWNAALEHAALDHSQNMAQEDFFGHEGGNLSSPWDRIDAAGYGNWFVLAENIAAGYQDGEDIVEAWLESPQHRENLLNSELSEAGIGYVYQDSDTYPGTTWGYRHYWTLDMGSRWDAYPLILAGDAFSTTSPSVSLYLWAPAGTTEMRLSNDGYTWSEWQLYEPLSTWELSAGNGVKWIYGQTRDSQGQVTAAKDDIFLLESEAAIVLPTQATFILQQGQSTGRPQSYRVQVADPTGEIRHWHADWDQDWLRLSANGGSFPTGVFLVLTDQAGDLAAGAYTATLSFWGGDMQAQIPVRLFVFPEVFTLFFPNVSRN